MPAPNQRNRRPYRPSGSVNGNLAHDLKRHELERKLERSGKMDFDQYYRGEQESRVDRRMRERKRARAAVRQPERIPLGAVVGGSMIAVLAILVVYCQVQINSISNEIVEMKKQISELETEQVSLRTKYEQAFDLTAVKETAEAAGMKQPADGQVIYIDLPGEDQAVTVGQPDESMLAWILSLLGRGSAQ
ncbi:MAG: hypothetical protein IJ955_09960 [Oscillospiraceae bacterium]|nr:hypothetical protein [Oscillospiraceae bacterium]